MCILKGVLPDLQAANESLMISDMVSDGIEKGGNSMFNFAVIIKNTNEKRYCQKKFENGCLLHRMG